MALALTACASGPQAPGDVAAVSADLDRLGLAHRAIGQVVAAGGEERVRIG